MVEIVSILDLEGNFKFPHFVEYIFNGYRCWSFFNMKDFFEWLRWKNKDYYYQVKSRHFFNNDNSLVEDFYSGVQNRRIDSRFFINGYLEYLSGLGRLPGCMNRIDLNFTGSLFREIQYGFLCSRKKYPSLPKVPHYPVSDYLARKYGDGWYKAAVLTGKQYNYNFDYPGSDSFYPDERFRTMFYDSNISAPTWISDTIRRFEKRVLV